MFFRILNAVKNMTTCTKLVRTAQRTQGLPRTSSLSFLECLAQGQTSRGQHNRMRKVYSPTFLKRFVAQTFGLQHDVNISYDSFYAPKSTGECHGGAGSVLSLAQGLGS